MRRNRRRYPRGAPPTGPARVPGAGRTGRRTGGRTNSGLTTEWRRRGRRPVLGWMTTRRDGDGGGSTDSGRTTGRRDGRGSNGSGLTIGRRDGGSGSDRGGTPGSVEEICDDDSILTLGPPCSCPCSWRTSRSRRLRDLRARFSRRRFSFASRRLRLRSPAISGSGWCGGGSPGDVAGEEPSRAGRTGTAAGCAAACRVSCACDRPSAWRPLSSDD